MSILDALEEGEESERTFEGKFKPGFSGNPLGRPKDDGTPNEKREAALTVASASAGKAKPGPKKKGLDFQPVTQGVVSVQDSIEKNTMPFMNAIWKRIQDGDEGLVREMLKIVVAKSQFANEFSGLQVLEDIDIMDLFAAKEKLRRETGNE